MESRKQDREAKGKFRALAWVSLITLCVAVTATGIKAQATQGELASASNSSPPSQLNMPLVGLDEGRRFQQARTVQPSSVRLPAAPVSDKTQTVSSLANVAGETINERSIAPTLGHPLPASTMSPLGTPRADFAVEKGQSATRATSSTQSSTSALSNTVIK